jgi:dipeptidyl-peptidase 4
MPLRAGMEEAFPAETYVRAERFCEWSVRKLVKNVAIEPRWLGSGERFTYVRQGAHGSSHIEVDPDAGTKRELPAAPLDDGPPAGRLRSPDGRWDLRASDGNLAVALAGADDFRSLTTDGQADHGYGVAPGSNLLAVTNARAGAELPPIAVWSPDSSRILTHRLDQRQVAETYLLEYAPADGFRSILHTYRMPLAGEPTATAELVVIDREWGTITPLAGEPLLVPILSPLELGWVWWGGDGKTVWFLREARAAKRLALCVADIDARTTREVIVESSETFVEPFSAAAVAEHGPARPQRHSDRVAIRARRQSPPVPVRSLRRARSAPPIR